MRIDETETTTRMAIGDLIDVVDGEPIDLCLPCYKKIGVNDDVDHPDYDTTDPVYHCAICGTALCSADN